MAPDSGTTVSLSDARRSAAMKRAEVSSPRGAVRRAPTATLQAMSQAAAVARRDHADQHRYPQAVTAIDVDCGLLPVFRSAGRWEDS